MRCNKLPSEALQKEQIGIWSLLFYQWMTDTFQALVLATQILALF